MALKRTAVGDVLYVWSSSSSKHAPTAMISAHGGEAYVNGMDQAPIVQLMYYSEHGHILTDPGIAYIVSGRCVPAQTINSRKSQDYELSKYTNTSATSSGNSQHNTQGETYDSVGSLDAEFKKLFDRQKGHNAVLEEIYGKGVAMDIITIRNRNFHKDPKLSDVLKTLNKNGFKYSEIHCSFCRGGQKAQVPKTKW